jgi:hypothetical protein
MEALQEGAPETVNRVSIAAEQTEASPPSTVTMQNNSSCQAVSGEQTNAAVCLHTTENSIVNDQDDKDGEDCSSTPFDGPCDSAVLHVETDMEQRDTDHPAQTSTETSDVKSSDPTEEVVSPFKPAACNLIPTTCPRDASPNSEEKATEQSASEALLLGLPADSLHAMASYLTPNEFCNFARCSQSSARLCREIFRRVRMHGFRCATEVITAWVS